MIREILVIDNYDSFTYNLVYLLRQLGCLVEVKRNDTFAVEDAGQYQGIVLSPGPGLPSEAGVMPDVVRRWYKEIPILGVCLGHQCIGEVLGGNLVNLSEVYHGKGMATHLVSPSPIFKNLPPSFICGRYHSWAIDPLTIPKDVEVTAIDEHNHIMAIQHRTYPVFGVQFHPESILTEHGEEIISNWCSVLEGSMAESL